MNTVMSNRYTPYIGGGVIVFLLILVIALAACRGSSNDADDEILSPTPTPGVISLDFSGVVASQTMSQTAGLAVSTPQATFPLTNGVCVYSGPTASATLNPGDPQFQYMMDADTLVVVQCTDQGGFVFEVPVTATPVAAATAPPQQLQPVVTTQVQIVEVPMATPVLWQVAEQFVLVDDQPGVPRECEDSGEPWPCDFTAGVPSQGFCIVGGAPLRLYNPDQTVAEFRFYDATLDQVQVWGFFNDTTEHLTVSLDGYQAGNRVTCFKSYTDVPRQNIIDAMTQAMSGAIHDGTVEGCGLGGCALVWTGYAAWEVVGIDAPAERLYSWNPTQDWGWQGELLPNHATIYGSLPGPNPPVVTPVAPAPTATPTPY